MARDVAGRQLSCVHDLDRGRPETGAPPRGSEASYRCGRGRGGRGKLRAVRHALTRCAWRHPRSDGHVHSSMAQENAHSRVSITWNGGRTKPLCTSCTGVNID